MLDRGSQNFRDPKVFWHEGDGGEGYWVMAIVEATDQEVLLYRADDLKDWDYLSIFGPANAVGGVWECPDLSEVPVDGDPNNTRWVLSVNLNPGAVGGGSGGQYTDTVTLQIYLDRSSVEVFSEDGTRTITDTIFPDTTSRGMSTFAEGWGRHGPLADGHADGEVGTSQPRRKSEHRPRHRGHHPVRDGEVGGLHQVLAASGAHVDLGVAEETGELAVQFGAGGQGVLQLIDRGEFGVLQRLADPPPQHGAQPVVGVEGQPVVHTVTVAGCHGQDVPTLAVGVVDDDVEDSHPPKGGGVLVDERDRTVQLIDGVEHAEPAGGEAGGEFGDTDNVDRVDRVDRVDGIMAWLGVAPALHHAGAERAVGEPGLRHNVPAQGLGDQVGRHLALGQGVVGEVPQRFLTGGGLVDDPGVADASKESGVGRGGELALDLDRAVRHGVGGVTHLRGIAPGGDDGPGAVDEGAGGTDGDADDEHLVRLDLQLEVLRVLLQGLDLVEVELRGWCGLHHDL